MSGWWSEAIIVCYNISIQFTIWILILIQIQIPIHLNCNSSSICFLQALKMKWPTRQKTLKSAIQAQILDPWHKNSCRLQSFQICLWLFWHPRASYCFSAHFPATFRLLLCAKRGVAPGRRTTGSENPAAATAAAAEMSKIMSAEFSNLMWLLFALSCRAKAGLNLFSKIFWPTSRKCH